MEFKPVIHYNGLVNFEASAVLNNVIAKLKGQFVHKIFLLLCFTALYSLRLFSATDGTINLGFILGEIIFIVLASGVLYYNIKMMRSIIVKIGSSVSIASDTVFIIPFTYRLPFGDKNQPEKLEFKINELKIRKTDNPSMFTRALGNKMFLLKDKEKEVYIVFNYFDPALKEKLTDILVKVTPAELLLPGRLRHY